MGYVLTIFFCCRGSVVKDYPTFWTDIVAQIGPWYRDNWEL